MYCVEVEGVEWDWFASDLDGHVALLSSGGSGQVPPAMIEHERVIDEFKTLAGIRCDERSWQVAADFGLYGYDADANGGPYVRLGMPSRPKCIDDLPEKFRALVRQVVVKGHFGRMQVIKCDQFSY